MVSPIPNSYREWVYARPVVDNVLSRENFDLREHECPPLQVGQALVRIKLVNIHSATRRRMIAGATKLGTTDRSNYACAEVLASRDSAFREGDIIACQAGWQDYQIVSSADEAIGYPPASELVRSLNGTNSQWSYVFRPALAKMWPSDVLMDVFGTSGMTAYFGVRECGPLMPADAVAVSGVAGSVGAIIAQLAKKAGSYVVGFAGSAERCDWAVENLGIDKCLNYRSASIASDLEAAFPDGIDVFLDGVSGQFAETILGRMNRHGRLFSYGQASSLFSSKPEAARKLHGSAERQRRRLPAGVEPLIKAKNIKVESWIVDELYSDRLKAEDDLSRLLLSGALRPINTVIDGFDRLPEAIVSLYEGDRYGKTQVRFVPI